MPPASFSPLTPRWCACCQNPLQGRSDKKFCSAACRGMAKRHGLADDAPDWPAQVEAAEQTVRALQAQLDGQAQTWQAAFPFEQRYDDLFKLLNVLILNVPSLEQMTPVLGFVDHTLQAYQQHPGLVTGEVIAQRRLGLLRELRAFIVLHQATLQERLQREREQKEQSRLRQEAAEAAARATEEATRLAEEAVRIEKEAAQQQAATQQGQRPRR